MSQARRGVLLVDVGTPKELTKVAIQEYLTEFLGDPFVIRGPRWLREIFFKKIVIPLRAPQSLTKYRTIWTSEGAPLRVGAQRLSEMLEKKLNQSAPNFWCVTFAFHYGGPSVSDALVLLKERGVQDLLIFPLYPQWALSTRGSLEDLIQKLELNTKVGTTNGFQHVNLAPIFFNHPGFLEAQSRLLRQALPAHLNNEEVAVVFSFHGLPESHIKAINPSCRRCLKRSGGICQPDRYGKEYCYRYQCFETAKEISRRAGLFHWEVGFQSRLGPLRWLTPSLNDLLEHWIEDGIKVVVIQCPSFVLDGLETLEEIGHELKTRFRARGGQNLILVPALNQSEDWIQALTEMVHHSNSIGELHETSETSSPSTPK